MSHTLTKQEMQVVGGLLQQVRKLKCSKLNYAVQRNIDRIIKEGKLITASKEPGTKYKEYELRVRKLQKKHAKTNEAGEPIMMGTRYVMKDLAAFDKENTKLEAEYKDALDEYEELLKTHEELLNEPSDVVFHKIKFDLIPEDADGDEMAALYHMIDHDDESAPSEPELTVVEDEPPVVESADAEEEIKESASK